VISQRFLPLGSATFFLEFEFSTSDSVFQKLLQSIDDIDSCDSLSLGVHGVCDSTSKKSQIDFLVAALDPALTACLDIYWGRNGLHKLGHEKGN
jgi:hypothetical protein